MLSRRTAIAAAVTGALGVSGLLSGVDTAVASAWVHPLGYSTVPTRQRAVALTFDDGPDPRFTPVVLDVLAAHGATATFFVVGSAVAAAPDLVRRMAAEGHEVANHTLSHERLDRLDRNGVQAQLGGGAAAIEGLRLGGASRSRLVRPPFGFEGPASRAELLAGRWEVARWRGCIEHHLRIYPGEAAAAALAAGAQPGDVLLAHDGGRDRSATVAVLPAVLERLAARGLAVTTIGSLQRGADEPAAQRQ